MQPLSRRGVDRTCVRWARDICAGYDSFQPLVAFWQCLLENPSGLAARVAQYHPLARNKFYALQKEFALLRGEAERAAVFYVLNRASYSGTTLAGGMSPAHPRFTKSSIERIKRFGPADFQVKHMDFRESLAAHANDFLYLDPPYANGGALYGVGGSAQTDFPHQVLADILKDRDGWILSYNDCEAVRKMYQGFALQSPQWTYGMGTSKNSNELLILSRDLKHVD